MTVAFDRVFERNADLTTAAKIAGAFLLDAAVIVRRQSVFVRTEAGRTAGRIVTFVGAVAVETQILGTQAALIDGFKTVHMIVTKLIDAQTNGQVRFDVHALLGRPLTVQIGRLLSDVLDGGAIFFIGFVVTVVLIVAPVHHWNAFRLHFTLEFVLMTNAQLSFVGDDRRPLAFAGRRERINAGTIRVRLQLVRTI